MEIDLTTPALLFSAISLIMLAYTNRFLSYAQLVRTLKDQYRENHSAVTAAQIANLRKRLYLISRKTKCSTFAKHFVPKSHLLTQFKM